MTDHLFDAFDLATAAAWELAAREELQGDDPWKKLTRQQGAHPVKPIYFPPPDFSETFQIPAATGSVRGPRSWYNCPRVTVHDPNQANAEALEHLQQGADGIFFELGRALDFRQLLKNIQWPYCSLSFTAAENESEHIKGLQAYLKQEKEPAIGAWYGSSFPATASHESFRFAGLTLSADATPETLADGIAKATKHNNGVDTALRINIGTDFFMEASRLRAIRAVWSKALAHLNKSDVRLFIHAFSPAWIPEGYQPHGNMIKATTAAMAAILGGCDALTIEPEDPSNTMMNRVARNVGNILREESHFNKVADPLAGSYYIDELTRLLTNELWNLIQPKIS